MLLAKLLNLNKNSNEQITLYNFYYSSFFGCNSFNKKMNKLLSEKKDIEIMIDTINQQDHRFRLITGYDEMDDSLGLNKQYPNSELVDSIDYLKLEKTFLENKLKEVSYSIDSLQKLK